MKKYLSFFVGLAMLFGASSSVLAVNDLTLETSVQISVGSETFVVSGSSAVIDSITVNSNNFAVTLSPDASLTVKANSGNHIGVTYMTNVNTSLSCNSSGSFVSLSVSGSAPVTTTITPSGDPCVSTSGGSAGAVAATLVVSVEPIVVSELIDELDEQIERETEVVNEEVSYELEETIVPITVIIIPPIEIISGVSVYKFSTRLAYGSEGNDVIELQERLTEEGFYNGPIIGVFGPLTQTAVKEYQKANGIDQAGIVGPLTRAELNSSVSVYVPVSSPDSQVQSQQSQSIIQTISQFRLQIKVFEDAQALIPSGNIQGIADVEVHIGKLRGQLLQEINQSLGL
jgi:Putative peptidoglycan binding domain